MTNQTEELSSKLKSWSFTQLKRWEITAILRTTTALHIGSGDISTTKLNQNEVEVNPCIKGLDGLPIIPGSTLKGILRAYLSQHLQDTKIINNVFGQAYISQSEQGRGGVAEFHDALFEQDMMMHDKPYPNWDNKRQTYIEASTAINRHTRTALDGSLHYQECVAPSSCFKLRISGDMKDQDAALIIKTLKLFRENTQPLILGADTANDKGKITIDTLEVKSLDQDNIIKWLNKECDSVPSTQYLQKLEHSKIEELLKQSPEFISLEQAPQYDITLQFAGPFMVNDPAKQEKDKDKNTADYLILTNEDGKSILPAKSFRGALRSQAERILRTMGVNCCDSQTPCKTQSTPCLICEFFGSTGWKTTLDISNFTDFTKDKTEDKVEQQFIAIDRFHGGGMEGALFSAQHTQRPKLTGHLKLMLRNKDKEKDELSWRKGFLGLIFRDLKEGDIHFGFGKNKGYGKIDRVLINNEADISALDIDNFRQHCKQYHCKQYHCDNVTFDKVTSHQKTAKQSPQKENINNHPNNKFHNPYHFIPVKPADTDKWLKREKLATKSTHHSHAFYRDKDKQGNDIYHGKIICQLTAETPFFIGVNDSQTKKQSENGAIIKEAYQLNNELAIPASSLRGMIASLAEAASNSALRVLDNALMTFRKKVEAPLKNLGMIYENKEGTWQLITMTDKIIKLKNAYAYNSHTMKDFLSNKHSWSPNHNHVYYLGSDVNEVPKEQYQEGMHCGILRILGKEGREDKLENKKHELFIKIEKKYIDTKSNTFDYKRFVQENNSIRVSEQAVSNFQLIANQCSKAQKNNKDLKKDITCKSNQWQPFHLKGTQRKREDDYCQLVLQNYDLVYFSKKENKVDEIAFSAIWRGKVADNVHAFFPEELRPFNSQRHSLSPAELLFGFVEQDEEENKKEHPHLLSFAGKVCINAGQLKESSIKNIQESKYITLKALSAPKLPSPALYFKPKQIQNNPYISKDKLNKLLHEPQGRKTYLHALRKKDGIEVQKLSNTEGIGNNDSAEFPWQSVKPDEHSELKVKIKPIKTGTVFQFDIDFTNLSAWELGLLCYAVQPNNEFCHKLGMGKPIGLGSVKIEIQEIKTINRKKRYSEDTISAERYHNNLDFKDYRNRFSQKMDSDIEQAITRLGDPKNIQCPVHYPQVEKASIEEENYKWFIANDFGSKKSQRKIEAALEAMIPISNKPLPTLTRHKYIEKPKSKR